MSLKAPVIEKPRGNYPVWMQEGDIWLEETLAKMEAERNAQEEPAVDANGDAW